MALRLGSLPGSSMAGAKGGLAAAGAATAADRSYKSGGGERNNGVAGDAGVADVEHQWQPCSGTVINDTLLDNNSNFNPDIKMGTLRHVTREINLLDAAGIIPEELHNLTHLIKLQLGNHAKHLVSDDG